MEGVNRESQFGFSWCHLCLSVFICGLIFILILFLLASWRFDYLSWFSLAVLAVRGLS